MGWWIVLLIAIAIAIACCWDRQFLTSVVLWEFHGSGYIFHRSDMIAAQFERKMEFMDNPLWAIDIPHTKVDGSHSCSKCQNLSCSSPIYTLWNYIKQSRQPSTQILQLARRD